jgi:hypothetical protein
MQSLPCQGETKSADCAQFETVESTSELILGGISSRHPHLFVPSTPTHQGSNTVTVPKGATAAISVTAERIGIQSGLLETWLPTPSEWDTLFYRMRLDHTHIESKHGNHDLTWSRVVIVEDDEGKL